MKEFFALLLAVILCFALVACSSSETDVNDDIAVTEAQHEKETEIAIEIPTENNIEETVAPTEAEEISFDTSWATNDFEALLPKLPFDGWKTSQVSDTEYEMELGGLKDSVITDDSGKTIGYGEDKEKLIDYLESLKDYGFTVEETGGIEGYEYEWLVIDPNGNEIEVTAAEGFCWIAIHKK